MAEQSRNAHRLRLHRWSEVGWTYSVTTCCEDKHPFFETPAIRDLVAQTIEEAVDYGIDILQGYVVMPDHVHLLLTLGSAKTLARAIGDLKKIAARRVNDHLGRRGAIWQRGYFEHTIRGEADYQLYLEYIVTNPARSGLVEAGEEYS